MTKPETNFIRRVGKYLPPEVYAEKTNNPYRGGTPDMYYEGGMDILWAEYKYLKKIPPVVDVSKLLSALQYRWLKRAEKNNRTIAVIVGSAKGGMVLHPDNLVPRDEYIAGITPAKELAEFIERVVTGCISIGS